MLIWVTMLVIVDAFIVAGILYTLSGRRLDFVESLAAPLAEDTHDIGAMPATLFDEMRREAAGAENPPA